MWLSHCYEYSVHSWTLAHFGWLARRMRGMSSWYIVLYHPTLSIPSLPTQIRSLIIKSSTLQHINMVLSEDRHTLFLYSIYSVSSCVLILTVWCLVPVRHRACGYRSWLLSDVSHYHAQYSELCPGRVRKTEIQDWLVEIFILTHITNDHKGEIVLWLWMMSSNMNFELDVLFEGPGALLTLDDDQVGHRRLHWDLRNLWHYGLQFDREVWALCGLHGFTLHLQGSGSGGGSARRS